MENNTNYKPFSAAQIDDLKKAYATIKTVSTTNAVELGKKMDGLNSINLALIYTGEVKFLRPLCFNRLVKRCRSIKSAHLFIAAVGAAK